MSEQKSDKWELPEPVFRRSTGELVKPSENRSIDPEPDTLEPVDHDASEPRQADDPDPDSVELELPDDPLAKLYAPPESQVEERAKAEAPNVDIQPQPFISEQLTAEEIPVESEEPKPKRKSRLGGIFLTFLLFLLGIAGVIIAVLYFVFTRLWPSGGD